MVTGGGAERGNREFHGVHPFRGSLRAEQTCVVVVAIVIGSLRNDHALALSISPRQAPSPSHSTPTGLEGEPRLS